MLTPDGVGFYSYMTAKVIPNTTESVDEVISPRFLFLSYFNTMDLIFIIYFTNPNKKYCNEKNMY